MGLWEMIAIVAVAGIIAEAYQTRVKAQSRQAELKEEFSDLGSQLSRIEERLNNLETLVVEEERHKEFDRAL